MSNDSTTAGYLTPDGNDPDYGEGLEGEISRWIQGLTGLAAERVFPLWREPQPETPPDGTTWCTFGITRIRGDASPAGLQGSESAEQWSHETLSLLVRFCGPAGLATAARFRDGMRVTQNNDELNRTGLTLIQQGQILSQPESINNQWVRRYDMRVDLRRKIIRQYGIKTLVQAPVQFFGD